MTHGDDYELSRLAYSEWNEQFSNAYVPWRDRKPGFVQRLLTALLGSTAEQAARRSERGKLHQSRTGPAK
jgi:hypothetical protein